METVLILTDGEIVRGRKPLRELIQCTLCGATYTPKEFRKLGLHRSMWGRCPKCPLEALESVK